MKDHLYIPKVAQSRAAGNAVRLNLCVNYQQYTRFKIFLMDAFTFLKVMALYFIDLQVRLKSKEILKVAMSGSLSYGEVKGFWIAAGGSASTASEAAAIAMGESRLEPGVIQSDKDYAHTGWGLWQITSGSDYMTAPQTYGVDYQLLDPWNNAEVAYLKYKEAGYNFDP